jgi:large subunit ribosomal protein L6
MSRIGRLPVVIPEGVTVDLEDNAVRVKGPKGELSRTLHPRVRVTREDGKISVARTSEEKFDRALHGLSRTLVANMIEGVTKGFERALEISGTGYRAQLVGKKLQLTLGFSHPVEMEPPTGISFVVETPQRLRVTGIDKEVVGEVAAKIRGLRNPDPYKAKGIKYAGEQIRRKAGKAGKVGAAKA